MLADLQFDIDTHIIMVFDDLLFPNLRGAVGIRLALAFLRNIRRWVSKYLVIAIVISVVVDDIIRPDV